MVSLVRNATPKPCVRERNRTHSSSALRENTLLTFVPIYSVLFPLLFAKRVATRDLVREKETEREKRLQATLVPSIPIKEAHSDWRPRRTGYLQPPGTRNVGRGERNATNQIKGRNDANNINLGITSPGIVDQKPVLSLHQVKVEHSRS